jgi:hypothetical protein
VELRQSTSSVESMSSPMGSDTKETLSEPLLRNSGSESHERRDSEILQDAMKSGGGRKYAINSVTLFFEDKVLETKFRAYFSEEWFSFLKPLYSASLILFLLEQALELLDTVDRIQTAESFGSFLLAVVSSALGFHFCLAMLGTIYSVRRFVRPDGARRAHILQAVSLSLYLWVAWAPWVLGGVSRQEAWLFKTNTPDTIDFANSSFTATVPANANAFTNHGEAVFIYGPGNPRPNNRAYGPGENFNLTGTVHARKMFYTQGIQSCAFSVLAVLGVGLLWPLIAAMLAMNMTRSVYYIVLYGPYKGHMQMVGVGVALCFFSYTHERGRRLNFVTRLHLQSTGHTAPQLASHAPKQFAALQEWAAQFFSPTLDTLQGEQLVADNPIVPGRKHLIAPSTLSIEQQIGKGAYGTVYKAMYAGVQVAVKVINVPEVQSAEILDEVKTEAELLAGMAHPSVLRFFGVSFVPEKRSVYLVTELMHTSLADILRRAATSPVWEQDPRSQFATALPGIFSKVGRVWTVPGSAVANGKRGCWDSARVVVRCCALLCAVRAVRAAVSRRGGRRRPRTPPRTCRIPHATAHCSHSSR